MIDNQSKVGKDCAIAVQAEVKDSNLSDEVVIDNYTQVIHSTLGTKVQLARMNRVLYSTLGRYTYTGQNTTILNATLGNFNSISWNVSIGGNTHDLNRVTTHSFLVYPKWEMGGNSNWESCSKECSIGNDVWIAAGVNLLRGVTVGSGAVIGAGCIVTKDVPPYAIVAGNPGKIIRYRCKDELIEPMLKLEWWNFPADVIRKNFELFHSELTMDVIYKLTEIKEQLKENGQAL